MRVSVLLRPDHPVVAAPLNVRTLRAANNITVNTWLRLPDIGIILVIYFIQTIYILQHVFLVLWRMRIAARKMTRRNQV